jgi:hypothetical protein
VHESHAFRGSRCPKKHRNRTFVRFPNLRRPGHVNNVLFKDEVWTFVDLVITNSTHGNFLAQVSSTLDFCSIRNNTNKRMKSLKSPWTGNQFLPLAIGVFYCLHKEANDSLQDWANNVRANTMWWMKGLEGPYFQSSPPTLNKGFQKLQASTILSWTIIIGLTTS